MLRSLCFRGCVLIWVTLGCFAVSTVGLAAEQDSRARRALEREKEKKEKEEQEAREKAMRERVRQEKTIQQPTNQENQNANRIRLAPRLETRPPEDSIRSQTNGTATIGAIKNKPNNSGNGRPPANTGNNQNDPLANFRELKIDKGGASERSKPVAGDTNLQNSIQGGPNNASNTDPRGGQLRNRGEVKEGARTLLERLKEKGIESGIVTEARPAGANPPAGVQNKLEVMAAKPPEGNRNNREPRNFGGNTGNNAGNYNNNIIKNNNSNNNNNNNNDNLRRGIEVRRAGDGGVITLVPRKNDDHDHHDLQRQDHPFQQGNSTIRLGPVTIGVPNGNNSNFRVGGSSFGLDPRLNRGGPDNRNIIVPHGDHFHIEKAPNVVRHQVQPKHVSSYHQNWYHGSWHDNHVYAPLGGNTWINLNYGTPALWWQTGYVSFCNPYYVRPPVVIYDYARPFTVVQRPVRIIESEATTERDAVAIFDGARAAFRLRDYGRAIRLIDNALTLTPNDGVMHEFRALTLFALGQYDEAAAVLNSLLAVTPGWDWATVVSLYESPDDYTDQLRRLETYRRENDRAAAPRFVLAYHYLITGYQTEAAKELKRVVELEPRDTVAQKLLETLRASLPKEVLPPAPGLPAANVEAPLTLVPPQVGNDNKAPEVPLPSVNGLAGENSVLKPSTEAPKPAENAVVPAAAFSIAGNWQAKREDGSQFALALAEDGKFTWQAKTGDQTHNLSGKYTLADTLLVLEGSEGALVARLSAITKSGFQFTLVGGPPGDKGLKFEQIETIK